jgi:hypothetical protein
MWVRYSLQFLAYKIYFLQNIREYVIHLQIIFHRRSLFITVHLKVKNKLHTGGIMINYSIKTKYEVYSVPERDVMWSNRCLQTLEKNMLPIYSGDKSKFLPFLSPSSVSRIATARFTETSAVPTRLHRVTAQITVILRVPSSIHHPCWHKVRGTKCGWPLVAW